MRLYFYLQGEQKMIEVWKAVKSYEGLYEISNIGRCRSRDLIIAKPGKKPFVKYGKVLALRYDRKGYVRYQLHKNGKRKDMYAHRLVAQAFIPNPNNYPVINHKDECVTNNHYTNLEWCTVKYNSNYGNAQKKKAASIDYALNAIKQGKKVHQYQDGKLLKTWNNLADAARALKVERSSIRRVCQGKRKRAGGYEWEYVDRYGRRNMAAMT